VADWNIAGKTVVVTGANSGIGLETARALASADAHVVMVCRSRERGGAALADVRESTGSDRVELMMCDMASLDSIRELAERFEATHDSLHVLVNNAGVMMGRRELSADGFEMTFAVNHLGYFATTGLLLNRLRASAPARVVTVSSVAHRFGLFDFDNLQGEKRYFEFLAYGTSKLCNIAFAYELARRLEGSGVTSNCLHPGPVGSNFGSSGGRVFRGLMNLGRRFLLTPEQGARTSVYLAASPEVSTVSGRYFVKSRPGRSSRASHNRDKQQRLWELSEELTGVRAP
jgi:NAD(P)-dependent dehydrogenase (short-subunit alcohol dehydrogenase family)